MGLGGLELDTEERRNLFRLLALGDQLKHLSLPTRQAIERNVGLGQRDSSDCRRDARAHVYTSPVTSRIARTRCATAWFFRTNPLTPARRASGRCWCPVSAVSRIVLVLSECRSISLTASIPFMSGMSKSRTATSGRKCRVNRIPSNAFGA